MSIVLTGIRGQARRPWLLAALTASVALNAFLIGAAATDLLRPHRATGPLRFELRWLEGKLPADGLARVQASVEGIEPQVQAHIDRMKQLRQSVGALAAAPQPDRAAIDARLAEIRAELMAMTTQGQAAVTDALLSLPPDMRAKLADGSAAPQP